MLERIKKEAFKDGDDYIVVFRSCSASAINQINAVLNPVRKADAYVKPLNKEIKFIDGKYAGMTPLDALAKDGDLALSYLLKNKKDDEMSEAVHDAIYQYISFKVSKIDSVADWSANKCSSFFKYCNILISEEEKKEISCGYASYSDFLEFALLDQKRTAIAKIIEKTKEVI